jgi:acyl-CoA thioesterase FadM
MTTVPRTPAPEAVLPGGLGSPSTVRLLPLSEGNNISYAIGFKHVNYLAEAAVQQHFKQAGVSMGTLYLHYALDLEVAEIKSRLGVFLAVDDEVEATVQPRPAQGSRMRFTVTMTVERDGRRTKVATSQVSVVLRVDSHTPPAKSPPEGLEPFVVNRIATAEPQDRAVADLTADGVTFGWRLRVPYFYCHFNERMQMSGFLRVMEEIVDRFLDDRGLSIKRVLDERNWIPVVTESEIQMLDEVLMEENVHTTYRVEDVFKNLLYTSVMQCWVERDGRLVHVATGRITHGYVTERAPNDWVMATLDDKVVQALTGGEVA